MATKEKRQPEKTVKNKGNEKRTSMESHPKLNDNINNIKPDPVLIISTYPLIVRLSKGYVSSIYMTILKSLNINLDGDEEILASKVLDEIHPSYYKEISLKINQKDIDESITNGITILSKEGIKMLLEISEIPENIINQIIDDESLWQDIFTVSLKIRQCGPV